MHAWNPNAIGSVVPPFSGGGGSGPSGNPVTRAEIDFGTPDPRRELRTTIVDALVTPTSKILVWSSGEAATGRPAADADWDQLILSAVAAPAGGSFTLFAMAVPGPILGRRVIFYQVV